MGSDLGVFSPVLRCYCLAVSHWTGIMRPRRRLRIGLVALMLGCGQDNASGNDAADRRAVRDAIARYQRAARSVNADSIAANFAPRGMLFEPGIPPIVSPDSIRAFVAMFTGAVVESATVAIDTLELHDASAYAWGSYYERLSFPGQPRSEQHGRFVMHWIRDSAGHWLLNRYFRVPVTTAVPPAPRE